jgi:hypothetical protein
MTIKGIENKVGSASAIAEAIGLEEECPEPNRAGIRDLRAHYLRLAQSITAEAVRQHRARLGQPRIETPNF